MILTGIDLLEINRFENLKTNKTFMNNNFTKKELSFFKKCNYNNSSIAGLYCAKEAFLKAIKKGINNYSLKDIEISHEENNAPFIILHNSLKDFKAGSIALSISHDGNYATAIVSILI